MIERSQSISASHDSHRSQVLPKSNRVSILHACALVSYKSLVETHWPLQYSFLLFQGSSFGHWNTMRVDWTSRNVFVESSILGLFCCKSPSCFNSPCFATSNSRKIFTELPTWCKFPVVCHFDSLSSLDWSHMVKTMGFPVDSPNSTNPMISSPWFSHLSRR